MRKRIVKVISTIVLLALLATTFSSCSLNSVSSEEYKDLFAKAVQDTLDEDLYYWKETVNSPEIKSFETCNVYAEIDKNYEPIRDENDEYKNEVIVISKTSNNKEVLKIMAGNSKSSNNGDSKDILFTSIIDENSTEFKKVKKEMSVHDYFNSEEFQGKYSPKVRLMELENLSIDDMDFEAKGCGITKKGNTTLAKFEIKDEYLSRYKSEFGKSSIFEGSTNVAVEIAFEKISALTVYGKEALGGGLSIETEKYKFEIVYFGPIATVPSYDEMIKDKAGNQVPVWSD